MAQAIPLYTRADPTAIRRALDEGYLTQPLAMGSVWFRGFQALATLNVEGLTLLRGELNTGTSGEGYVDRRHPHTYAHEIMVGGWKSWSLVDASLYAGRGFVPFGSDDPMARPLEKYPVNHHLAQILERLVAIAAVRTGPVVTEVALFNGDEPLGARWVPTLSRFGDSWSGRVTFLPVPGAELSGSAAWVASPEQPSGHGLDQRKASVVAQWFNPRAPGTAYALAEWARTDDRDAGTTINTLHSVLAEGAMCRAGVRLAGRFEHTDRAEEETTLDPFRTARPATDLSNLGVSRWTTYTAALSALAWQRSVFTARPFVEIARIYTRPGNPAGLFQPQLRYGTRAMWMYSVGVTLRAGTMHPRMGRYGVAAGPVSNVAPMGTMGHQHGSEINPRSQSSSDKCALF
jgi:hypothetical protein